MFYYAISASELNTRMRIHEITNGLKTFIATVRVENGSGSTTVTTALLADGLMQARAILGRIFGEGNVLAVLEAQQMTETVGGTKTLSASELRVKSLADQARKLNDKKKQEIARQSLDKAQKRMSKANNPLLKDLLKDRKPRAEDFFKK